MAAAPRRARGARSSPAARATRTSSRRRCGARCPTTRERGLSAAQIAKQIDASLERLQTDYVDLYQAHRFDPDVPIEETIEALQQVVASGKARYLGFSEWTPEQIQAAIDIAGPDLFVSSQPQYSMLWQAPEAEVFPLCAANGISQIVWSPLAQGLLTGKYRPGEPPPRRLARRAHEMGAPMQLLMSDERLEAVDRLRPVAEQAGLSLAELALAWVLRRPELASAIVGASRPEQVHANAKASGIELTPDTLAAIDAALGTHRSRSRRSRRSRGRRSPTAEQGPQVPGMDRSRVGGQHGGRSMRRFARSSAAAMVVSLVCAGCGGGHGETPPKRPAPLPSASKRCGPPDAPSRTVRFRTRDGVMLDGAVVGSGPVGAVLVHEYPGGMCGWWRYADYLARHGVQALLFDLRCFDLSGCPAAGRGRATADVAAAMAELRRHGARRIALVGASMGGAIAVVAAARLRPAALVDLSGERSTRGLTPGIDADAGAAAGQVTAPALFVVAHGDRYVPIADMRLIARRARSASKQLVVLPAAAGHGWVMLDGTTTEWSPLAARVARSSAVPDATGPRARRRGPPPAPAARAVPGGGSRLAAAADARRRRTARRPPGSGRLGVVFVDDSTDDPCAWAKAARDLTARGHAVAVFKAGGGTERKQALAVASSAPARRQRRVVLIGASVGARAALQAAATHPPGVAGVVSLSAERRVRTDLTDLLQVAPRVRLPVLSIGARNDALTRFGATREPSTGGCPTIAYCS